MKKTISLLLSLVMLFSITAGVDLSAYALSDSGSCGDNVTYTFDSSTGTLTISGTGSMYDYYINDYADWIYCSSPFSCDTAIKSVVINDGVTSIGNYTFYRCSSLTSITIPDSVTSIGGYAFYDCTSLSNVTIGNSVTSIGYCAFYNCINLTNIEMPESVTSIGANAFYRINNIIYHGSATGSPWGAKAVNGYVDGYLIYKDSSEKELLGCAVQASIITIPNSVTTIGDSAFYGCASLTSVTIPDGVTSISNCSFYGCSSLTNITIPNNVTTIGNSAFYGCSSLTSATIPDSVTSIGDSAFYNCTSLTSITLGYGISVIGSGAFAGCNNIQKTNFTGTVNDWVNIKFCSSTDEGSQWCSSNPIRYSGNLYINDDLVTNVSVTGVENISDYAFENCDSIKSFTATNDLKKIGTKAFAQCDNLSSISIPSDIKLGGSYADRDGHTVQDSFNAANINYIGIAEKSSSISTDFSQLVVKSNIKELIIPDSISYIPDAAFKDCITLTSATIPKSVTRIEYNAFSGCTNLTIKGYKDSYAQTYSSLLGIPFEAIDNTDIHVHKYVTTTTKATTSKNGSVVTKCSLCGAVKSKSTIYYPKTISISTTSYTYDGKVKKPTVKVVGSNGKTISSSNYTVTYASGRKNVGKYAVKITFKGNYSGTKTLYFTIKPKATSISSVSAGSKKFTVKWKKQSTQVTGYQIQYSTSSKFTSPKTVTVSSYKTTSKTISKLKSKKKYYIRVRTYKTVSGTKYYSSWSKAKSVTTKK